MIDSMRKNILATLLAGITAVSVISAPVATAAPIAPAPAQAVPLVPKDATYDSGVPIVMFGDSMFANPSSEDMNNGNAEGNMCPRGDFRVATVLAQSTGKDVADYSCNGSTFTKIKPMVEQVARGESAMDESTEHVFFMAGFNDFLPDPFAASPKVDTGWDTVISMAKEQAPNAQIHVLSYPSASDMWGNICMVNGMLAAPAISVSEATANDWARQAAARNGVSFTVVGDKTTSTCASPDRRWVSNPLDSQVEANMPFHLTTNGVHGVANIVAGIAS